LNDEDYIAGFDAGYSYVLCEIESWRQQFGDDLNLLLEHLKDKKEGEA
jgi:hypothetical protein